MLTVQRFVKGKDEPVWVEILNVAYRDYEVWWGSITVEEMLQKEKRPDFDSDGRFIVELDGKPVGIVRAHVDDVKGEKKGFIYDLCVVPEFHGHAVEEKLLEAAMDELEKRGVISIQAWTGTRRRSRIRLLEGMGFEMFYRTFDMEMELAKIPSDIGENPNVGIRLLRKDVEEDIRTLNRLTNECFKEFLNYPPYSHLPEPFDETRESVLKPPESREQEFLFAVKDRKDVGWMCIVIDEEYNIKKNVRIGRIKGIGVLKSYRRKGTGTRLMLHGLEMLKAKGMTKAMLDTEDFNPDAVRFYKEVGFKVVEEYLTYIKRLHTYPCSN